MSTNEQIKLIAFDIPDLQVISAFIQDGIFKFSTISYKQSSFAITLSRVQNIKKAKHICKRCLTQLRINQVKNVSTRNIDLQAQEATLVMLAIEHKTQTKQNETLHIYLAGGGEIKIQIECIELLLTDLGSHWSSKATPNHLLY